MENNRGMEVDAPDGVEALNAMTQIKAGELGGSMSDAAEMRRAQRIWRRKLKAERKAQKAIEEAERYTYSPGTMTATVKADEMEAALKAFKDVEKLNGRSDLVTMTFTREKPPEPHGSGIHGVGPVVGSRRGGPDDKSQRFRPYTTRARKDAPRAEQLAILDRELEEYMENKDGEAA